ncbi:uncharacterized protein N7477_009883 [Penicillium maclennaniae]|uniref:uncharacterized protein n=1 Tax=Penicillium maclennaniae TaxID=1343394 RepID=UPI002541C102|nr:uncharacterized protein N7477_009883 [Penicillium maclennaniae]KAJ5662267.1 hypothetical protein N7477_009883 [Penicillium maclennaniae]
MKASFFALVAAATAAFAAPAPAPTAALSGLTDLVSLSSIKGLADDLKLGDVTKELKLDELPKVSSIGDLTKLLNLDSAATNGMASKTPIIQNGKVLQDLGPELQNILVITGPNVTALLSGLGLGALGAPVGGIVASASGLGGLVTGLAPYVNGLVTVVGADVGALLVGLSPEVTGLVSGLGLPSLGVPVGTVIATVGTSLKRGEIVQDIAPSVGSTLRVTGANGEELLVKLSPSVAALVTGLGLPTVGVPLGSVLVTAGQGVDKLLSDLSIPITQVLTITGEDGQDLLVKLSPEVVSLVSGLGLPTVGTPVGAVVATVGKNL